MATISEVLIEYEQTLRSRSKLTQRNYLTSLRAAFVPWLAAELRLPSPSAARETSTYDLPPDSLEKYYLWLGQASEIKIDSNPDHPYSTPTTNTNSEDAGGAASDNTINNKTRSKPKKKPAALTTSKDRAAISERSAGAYLAAAKSFFQFLQRRELLAPSVNYLRMVDGLKQVLPRNANSYDTPHVDRLGLPEIVRFVLVEPIPALVVTTDPKARVANQEQRLEVLRDKAVILTLWATGMRRAEVAELSRKQVADGRQAEAIIRGKGRKERNVWFDELTLAAIVTYLRERGDTYQPLFLRHDRARGEPGAGGKHYRLSAIAIWQIVKKWAAKAGTPTAKTHDFRHAKATNMLNRGAKLEEVQDILGHASPVTTKQIYAHYAKSHLADVNTRYSVSVAEILAKTVAEVPD